MSINATQSASGLIGTPHLRVPNPCLVKALVAHVVLLGDAFGSAYAAPFLGHRRHQSTGTDQDIQGRDPSRRRVGPIGLTRAKQSPDPMLIC